MTAHDDDRQRRALRRRALARLEPLSEIQPALRAGFSSREGWDQYDALALALEAINEVVERMGLGAHDGADPDEVATHLAATAEQMRPGNPHDAREAAEWVLSWLCNARDGGRSRPVYYTDQAHGWQRRRVDVTLLREDRSPVDGRVVLRASTEAVNTVVVALDLDVADAQVAAEAILESQLRSGRLDRAAPSARQAQLASRQYAARVQEVLELTRRDVAVAGWGGDADDLLAEARDHLDQRRRVEASLHDTAQAVLDHLGDDQTVAREQAGEVLEAIRDCQQRHHELLSAIMPARQEFLDAQLRQQFADAGAVVDLSPTGDVLVPACAASADDSVAGTRPLVDRLTGQPLPRCYSVVGALDRLLAAPRPDPPTREHPTPSVDELTSVPAATLFTSAQQEATDAALRGVTAPASLSELLDRCDAPADLLAFAALARLDGSDPRLRVSPTGQRLLHPLLDGDDLELAPSDNEDSPSP